LFEAKKNVIYGAYGNSETDVEAYLKVGIRYNLFYYIEKLDNKISRQQN
jgi:hypothetical protein